MNLPSRRRLSVAALIVAGLGALLVPFMLHSPTSQPTSPTPSTTKTTTTTTTTTSPHSGGDTGTSDNGGSGGNHDTGTCSEDKPHHDPKHTADPQSQGNGKHKGHAFGVIKNQLDTTVAAVKAMGSSNPAFHLHHDTDTDNAAHSTHATNEPSDHDSSCATDDNDDAQGQED